MCLWGFGRLAPLLELDGPLVDALQLGEAAGGEVRAALGRVGERVDRATNVRVQMGSIHWGHSYMR